MSIAQRLYRPLALALSATLLAGAPAAAAPRDLLSLVAFEQSRDQPSRDQDRAFRATREGRSMPLPQIERRVLPQMGGADYLGPEFKGDTYRLKFMQQDHVIWVDVEAATGRIVRRSGK